MCTDSGRAGRLGGPETTRRLENLEIGILNPYTTTLRGWRIEAFVSFLVQSQSQTSLPGGGGV